MMKGTCPLCGKRRMLLSENFYGDDCKKETGFEIYDAEITPPLYFHQTSRYDYLTS